MGIISWLFNRVLAKKIAKSPDFQAAAKDVDTAKTKLQRTIIRAEKEGTIIPDELKQFAGIEIMK